MTPEEMIGRAILADNDEDRQLNMDRSVLNYAVAKAVFCKSTGAVLDQSSAIYVEFFMDGKSAGVMGPWSIPHFAEHAKKSEEEAVEKLKSVSEKAAKRYGFTSKIYNGRELFGGDTSPGGS